MHHTQNSVLPIRRYTALTVNIEKGGKRLRFIKKTCLFTSKILPVLLILAISGVSFVSLVATSSLKASAAISYWIVPGDFNSWDTSSSNTAKISGGSGSVTVDVSSYIGDQVGFKMIANEGGNIWCGLADSSISSITAGVEYELAWNGGSDIHFTPSKSNATFTISVKNGTNYLTVTESGSSGGIKNWVVAGNFNDWNGEQTNTSKIDGTSGSVTVDMSSYIGKSQGFKMVAYKNNTKYWCGLADANVTITYGQEYELQWDDGEQMFLVPSQKNVTFTISSRNNKNYLTVTESGSSGGGGTGSGKAYTAKPDSTITGNSNLFQIDASFYDYYTDTEVSNGWRNTNYVNSHGDWEPYTNLNRALAQYASNNSVSRPLYFGNFYGKDDGYTGAESSNLVNFSNWVNNSSRLGGYNRSVVGLTGRTLTSNQLRYYSKDSSGTETDNGAIVPLFDENWLVDNGLGSVVDTKFPMRKTTKNNVTYYEFDSMNATDNIWFSNYGSSNMTVSYGAGTDYGVYDALDFYSDPKENCGYGFFPFDQHGQGSGDQYNRATDFAFGMRVDIPFNIGVNGKINGVEQVFEFTGDDDVWVYVDGVLVLDLGGDHKKAQGSINFSTLTSTVSTGTNTVDTVTRNGAFPSLFGTNGNSKFDNTDPNKTHTLTMFYMERGMIESNLKFGFNFTAVENQFVVENNVDVTDINSGLQNDVKLATDFDYKHTYSSAESGTYSAFNKLGTYSTGSQNTTKGSFTLKDSQSISVTGSSKELEAGKYYKVNETYDSVFNYYTTWKAVDMRLQDAGYSESNYTIASDTDSANASFLYNTLDTGVFASTRVKLIYTNTPESSFVDITKEVKNYAGNVISDDTEFPATVTVSLDGGSTFKSYNLDYTLTDSNGSTSQGVATNGKITLKQGNKITIDGLPIGTVLKVQEDAVSGYNNDTAPTAVLITVDDVDGNSGVSEKIINQKNNPGQVTANITGQKQLKGWSKLGHNAFTFELRDKTATGTILATKDVIASGVNMGVATFTSSDTSSLIYTADDAGKTFTYYVVEKAGTDSDIIYSDTAIKVTVKVTLNESTNKLSTSVSYDNGNIITNTVKTGAVNIVKADNVQNSVQNAGFSIYKSDKYGNYDVADIVGEEQFTGADGKASFTDLKLYKDGYTYQSTHTDDDYQYYTLVETTTPLGYNINKTIKTFKFPTDGNYTYTAEITNYITATPNTSGEGMTAVKVVGICITGFAGLALCSYLIYSKKFAKKRIKLEK